MSRQKSLQQMTKVSYMLTLEELQEMDMIREDISRSLFSRRAVRKILQERNKQKEEAEGEE
jgi:metal-responsive CopG/Arc/MetJ family transcriptional regulator